MSVPTIVWEGGSVESDCGCERGESEVAESGEVSKPECQMHLEMMFHCILDRIALLQN